MWLTWCSGHRKRSQEMPRNACCLTSSTCFSIHFSSQGRSPQFTFDIQEAPGFLTAIHKETTSNSCPKYSDGTVCRNLRVWMWRQPCNKCVFVSQSHLPAMRLERGTVTVLKCPVLIKGLMANACHPTLTQHMAKCSRSETEGSNWLLFHPLLLTWYRQMLPVCLQKKSAHARHSG